MVRPTLLLLPLLWLLPALAFAISSPRQAERVQQLSLTFTTPAPFCASGTSCEGEVLIAITAESTCEPNELAISAQFNAFNQGVLSPVPLSGSYPDYTLGGFFPIGEHSFVLMAEDACGNTTSDTLFFSMVDCQAPTPICISGLSMSLMPHAEGGGIAVISASEFVASPILGECSPPNTFLIYREGEASSFSSSGSTLTLTCDDFNPLPGVTFSQGFVEIYALDNAYNPYSVQPDGTVGGPNYSYCSTFISLSDPFGACGPITTGSISGIISTPDSTVLPNVNVRLSGTQADTLFTNVLGNYGFSNLPAGDYTVTPFPDDSGYTNGVTVLDLILISRHILGIEPLGSPYKLIAADANYSGTITVIDLITLRRQILLLQTQQLPPWRFIPSTYVFPDPGNPWTETFPEATNITVSPGSTATADFIGIKIGDVDYCVTPPLMSSEDRSDYGTLVLEVADLDLRSGEQYTVPLRAIGLSDISGCQFSLHFDHGALALASIKPRLATEAHLGLAGAAEGTVTACWHTEATPATEEVLFSLVFTAKADGRLSQWLSVGARPTHAEAYDQTLQRLGIALRFSDSARAGEGFVLYPNAPNPFRDETALRFHLPEAGMVRISIADASGRVCHISHIAGTAGLNIATLDRRHLPVTGVLYCTVSMGGHSATLPMLRL